MIRVHMNNEAMVMREVKLGTSIQTLKYKDLTPLLAKENEIEVNYCFGQLKLRTKLLTKLGFKLKETIFFNDEALYSRINEVWSRA